MYVDKAQLHEQFKTLWHYVAFHCASWLMTRFLHWFTTVFLIYYSNSLIAGQFFTSSLGSTNHYSYVTKFQGQSPAALVWLEVRGGQKPAGFFNVKYKGYSTMINPHFPKTYSQNIRIVRTVGRGQFIWITSSLFFRENLQKSPWPPTNLRCDSIIFPHLSPKL